MFYTQIVEMKSELRWSVEVLRHTSSSEKNINCFGELWKSLYEIS